MKIIKAILAAVLLPSNIQGKCLSNFEVSIKGPCKYSSFRDAVQYRLDNPDEISYDASSCGHDADQELLLMFPNKTIDDIESYVYDACEKAVADTHTGMMPWSDITQKGVKFDKEHFDGNGDWNEQRQTNYRHLPYVLNEPSNVLKRDAQRVDDVYEGFAQSGPIQWPGDAPTSMTNFENCELQSAMCCWVSDRQANDNNGNCNSPYDTKCIDKDPADNTEICGVSMKRSIKDAVHVDDGFLIYEKDEEGPTHCHGFAWGQDESEADFRYRANNLFYVSMSDHLHDRGYVRPVQGAPMCACVENMPIVTRSDCTEIHATELFTFTFSYEPNPILQASLYYTEIDFNACSAQTNNDLQSFMERLLNEGRVNQEKYEKFRQTVRGNGNCPSGISDLLFEQGYRYDPLLPEDFVEIGYPGHCQDRNGNNFNNDDSITIMEGDFTNSEEKKAECLAMCSAVSASVRATGCHAGDSRCKIITKPVFFASGDAGKTCWMAKRRDEPDHDDFLSYDGYCRGPDNENVNGVVHIRKNIDYGPSEEKQQECLDLCRKYSMAHEVTGCTAKWHQSNRGCYIYTGPTFKGSGHDKHHCWVFAPSAPLTRQDFRSYPGKCLSYNGNEQNSGKIFLANGNFNTESGKLQCLDMCISYSSEYVKGCQAESSKCYVYTEEVSSGNGSGSKTCFIPGH